MLLALMLMLLPMTGCTTLTGIGGTNARYVDTACSAFKAISWSKNDTDQTIREVKSYNAAYDRICPKPPTS